MSNDPRTAQRAAALQATVVLGGLVILLVVLAYFALRDTGRAADSMLDRARTLLESATQAESEPTTASAPEPPAVAPGVAETAPTPPEREAPTAIQDAVSQCVPSLLGLAEGVRLLALDASVHNVDFIQESAGTPGHFVRISCVWNGAGFDLTEFGRMVVPPLVGDPRRLPPELVDKARLDADWFTSQIEAAVHAAQVPGILEVKRVEISQVAAHGVLTRVRMQRSTGPVDVLLDRDGRTMPDTTPFPQVERMPDLTEEAAERGYRDLGQTIWSVGVMESLDQLRDKYFSRGEKFLSLEFVGFRVTAYLPDHDDAKAALQVTIDEYADKHDPEPSERYPHFCVRPFTLREARTALEAAIRARGETLAEFEAIEFQHAIVDCLNDARRPAWRFEGG